MTFIAVPIFVHRAADAEEALAQAARAASAGANLIEWRIDELVEQVEAEIAVTKLVSDCPLPCILTARRSEEGGEFTGLDVSRSVVIDVAARCGQPPRYVDVEEESFRSHHRIWRLILGGDVALILSLHDFIGRPRDLLQRIESMVNEPACAVIKVAWMARSLRDNLQAFDLLAERKKPMIALCMGRFGLISRVLAPKFGGLITFASLEKGDESAPGQPSIAELKSLYRFDSIGRDTRVYGVIGWPVEHSRSPAVHNAGFEAIGFDGVYLPMPIPPEWEHFKATVGELIDHPRLNFRGASVTIPHKQNLLRFVEERGGRIDDYARLAGAANTLIVGSAGGLACANTDAPAIVAALLPSPPGRGAGGAGEPSMSALSQIPLTLPSPGGRGFRGARIAILGAGGMARSAVAGLMMHDAAITIFNRTRETAEQLVQEFVAKRASIESRSIISVGDAAGLERERYDVYINCTSVGMKDGPAPGQTPFEALDAKNVPFDDGMTVLDTVYTPSRTPLLEEAAARGARIMPGSEVFLHQAALQFESWTGKRPPMEMWRRLLPPPSERGGRGVGEV